MDGIAGGIEEKLDNWRAEQSSPHTNPIDDPRMGLHALAVERIFSWAVSLPG
jgi:hypothetical protein